MSIKAYLLGVLGVLATLAIAISLAFAFVDWKSYQRAATNRTSVEAFRAALKLTQAMGIERGVGNVLLTHGGGAELLPQIRTDTDAAFGEMELRLRRIAETDLTSYLTALDAIRKTQANLRTAVDRALAPADVAPAAEPGQYVDRALRSIDQVRALADRLKLLVVDDSDAVTGSNLAFAELAGLTRAFVGNQATSMEGAILAGAPARADLLRELDLGSGKSAALLRQVRQSTDTLTSLDAPAGTSRTVATAILSAIERKIATQESLHARLRADVLADRSFTVSMNDVRTNANDLTSSLREMEDWALEAAAARVSQAQQAALVGVLATTGFMVIAILVIGVSLWLVRSRILAPLLGLTGAVRNLAERRYELAVPILDRSDELGRLAQAIETVRVNAMRAEAMEGHLRQAQKMEAVGQLTGGLAHDFNNLIGIMLGNMELLAERFAAESEERELLDDAMAAAMRGAEVTRQLLAFSRQQPLASKRTDLVPLLEESRKLLSRTIGEAITLDLGIGAAVWPVLIDGSQLQTTILNLAVNARDAMPNGGWLRIEASNVSVDDTALPFTPELRPGDYVVIAVSDTGRGMAPEVLQRAFEPFFTTKGSLGTGLGLSMVHGFVKQSGGHTQIYSEPGRGTTVRIYLPRADLAASAPARQAATALPSGTGETILVVEDNEWMRDVAVRQLESLGYRTIAAADPAEALDRLRSAVAVDLLFTDVIMPGGMDGAALAAAARRLRPALNVLYTSGFAGHAAGNSSDPDFTDNLLTKPYRKDELARRIREALDRAPRPSADAATLLDFPSA